MLDHHQIEAVEPREVVRVRQRVGRVGVHHQRNRAEAAADHLDRLEVPAGLDLDLDPPVPGGELNLDTFGEQVERVLDTDRDARGNPRRDDRRASAEDLRERALLLHGKEIPRRHFDRGLRHVVPADAGQRGKDLPRMPELAPEDHGGDELRDDVPRGARRLRAVERVRIGHALAELGQAFDASGHRVEELLLAMVAVEDFTSRFAE